MDDETATRRRYLAAIGALGAAGVAGCSGLGSGGSGAETPTSGSADAGTPTEGGAGGEATPTGGSDGPTDGADGTVTGSSGTATATTTPIEGSLDGWPVPGRNAANTRYGADGSAPTGDVRRRWQLEVAGGSEGVTVADGTIYVSPTGGSKGPQNYVLAVDAATGTERWRKSLSGTALGPPTVAGDAILVGNDGGPKGKRQVYALNAGDGSVRWKRNMIAAYPILPSGDTVYVPTTKLRALDLASGETKWTYAGNEFRQSSRPVLGDERVYAVDGSTIHAVSPDGKAKWTARKPEDVGAIRDLAFADGTLYTVGQTRDGRVAAAVSAADGATEWTRTLDVSEIGRYGPGSIVVGERAVFFGVRSGGESASASVVSLARADGADRWRKSFDGTVPALAAAGDTVVAGASDTNPYEGPKNGTLAAYGRADGSRRWRFRTAARDPTPAVVDGAVFANGFFETRENAPTRTVLLALTD